MDDFDKLSPEARDLLVWATVADVIRDALEVARIHDRTQRPLQQVEAANGDPKELVFCYWMLAARARDDVRTLLSRGWGL